MPWKKTLSGGVWQFPQTSYGTDWWNAVAAFTSKFDLICVLIIWKMEQKGSYEKRTDDEVRALLSVLNKIQHDFDLWTWNDREYGIIADSALKVNVGHVG